jgi:DNA-binding transcriptional MocR family regulator
MHYRRMPIEIEWIEPRGGVVGFFRLRPAALARTDVERFYHLLFERYRTLVGAGHWFEQPRHYMRIGYGWPPLPELRQGLQNLSAAVAGARR